ncbi:D-2-hydroxyacid dehydrogenase family protein [Salinarimonas soli]|uniref:D-2-hydroxyacid dehydrogenase family protein n=1 Tax=Salinarimonas soli TaxID=1638099 RepID=A0A5B2VE14_9HYPH|nr:D-2-hydroxyacid dehydrogenase family protein [Salinarimonas soli]KAA2237204.1 D-2-hydroxyacid dehydrogenase family protein [Salinarimonas soli]
MSRVRIAVLDDTQDVALGSADWSALEDRAEITVFREPFADEDAAARALAPFAVLVPMRERTPFPASLIARLPALRLVALTGARAPSLDVAACTAHGVLVCNTAMDSAAATAELAFALILACARAIPGADAAMRAGGWHGGVPLGTVLAGKRLGVLGLGKLGSRVAGYGRAFGMEVVAWSQNLTAEAASAGGARLVSKEELFAASDVVSIHLVLSERTRGLVGGPELAAMRDGAILVNTSRGPIVDEAALLAELARGRLRAGLDVFDREPLPAGHPLRSMGNVVLTPHLGYATASVFAQVYRESVENIDAFLAGRPIRVVNPDALGRHAR